ncbi:vitamin B12 ABC transporter substrate-binding protein BtuF [Jejubacter calystegiae]|uniref:Vitamin B12-binding protein n=1 Tax=Jejubacter calystegiae TaxID=2579935 RepID=A0A4P8YH46_9ENTR|nr:vitamin B12 ABC transporter substrate-binding protein BtuF [Jejubacter calystegiae]QCT19951.1 vitamin B12 ABC transporter substrate-binding protein BtuF [Jejubacter calystegiae]
MANRPGRATLCALLMLLPAWLFAAPRVISLSPANTELAFAAGITPVAVSAWSDYPEQAKSIEQVADWQGIKVERILALKPDLVLAWRGGNPSRPVEQLSRFGIKVLWLDPTRVEEVANALQQLADWSPAPDKARQAAARLRDQWRVLQQQYSGRPKRPVFLQFGDRPLFTSSARSLQNQLLKTCGGDNIFAESKVPWPQVSREQVLARQPQAIITPGGEQKAAAVRRFWGATLPVPVIGLKEDWFERAGPRIILAARQLCGALSHLKSPS